MLAFFSPDRGDCKNIWNPLFYPSHEMMMHIYDTDQVLQNLDVSTTSCSIYVPNSFRVRITKRRIRMILSYDRALAAKPDQRYGESAEWETSPPQKLEKDI